MLQHLCCCLTLRAGCIVAGVASFFGAFLAFLNLTSFYNYSWPCLLTFLLDLSSSACLLFGGVAAAPALLLAYVVVAALLVATKVFLLARLYPGGFVVYAMVYGKHSLYANLAVTATDLVFSLYFMLVAFAYWRKLKNESSKERPSADSDDDDAEEETEQTKLMD